MSSATAINKTPNYNSSSIYSINLEYDCDAIEIVPSSKYTNSLYYVVGNYQLIDNKRIGRLNLYKLDKNNRAGFNKPLQIIDTDGILDIKWNNNNNNNNKKELLATVDADSKLNIYELIEKENKELMEKSNIKTNDSIALYVDWNNNINNNLQQLAVSYRDGKISIFDLSTSLSELASFNAHDYETWVLKYGDINTLYSGSDDTLLKSWDLRSNKNIFVNNIHKAGVTSIEAYENTLFTGSYDENIYLWDIRNMKSPLSIHNTGGGVWRLKYNSCKNLLLAACMHNGMHIIEFDNNNMVNVCDYMNHDSMSYGCDWYEIDDTNKMNILSCSFYDKSVHLWEYNGNK